MKFSFQRILTCIIIGILSSAVGALIYPVVSALSGSATARRVKCGNCQRPPSPCPLPNPTLNGKRGKCAGMHLIFVSYSRTVYTSLLVGFQFKMLPMSTGLFRVVLKPISWRYNTYTLSHTHTHTHTHTPGHTCGDVTVIGLPAHRVSGLVRKNCQVIF